jgi:hypothetical protein
LRRRVIGNWNGPYGKGYPRGKKMAAGRTPCGRATPQMAVRPFGGGPPTGRIRVSHGACKNFREFVDTPFRMGLLNFIDESASL